MHLLPAMVLEPWPLIPIADIDVAGSVQVRAALNQDVVEQYAEYWILDGQHRVAALKMFFAPSDPGVVDCEVFENLTDAEAANIFLGRSNNRAIGVFEKFFVGCTAGYTRETDIRRTVESQHLKVSQQKEPGCVGAVHALQTVYDRAGAVVLGQTLRTLRDAYDSDAAAFDGQVI